MESEEVKKAKEAIVFNLNKGVQASLVACDKEPLTPTLDGMISYMNKIRNDFLNNGNGYRCALMCPIAFSELVNTARFLQEPNKSNKPYFDDGKSGNRFKVDSFVGIEIDELEGLDGECLFFKDYKTRKYFLELVDNNKMIMHFSQKEAVKEAIKIFSFISNMNNNLSEDD